MQLMLASWLIKQNKYLLSTDKFNELYVLSISELIYFVKRTFQNKAHNGGRVHNNMILNSYYKLIHLCELSP